MATSTHRSEQVDARPPAAQRGPAWRGGGPRVRLARGRVLAGAVVCCLSAGLLAGAVPTAGAAPTQADVAQEIAAARAQLAALQDRTESLAEAYNAGRIRLAVVTGDAANARARVARADAAVTTARTRMGAFVADAYRSGGVQDLSALQQADPQTFLDRAATLDQLSRQREDAERALRVARSDLTAARQAAEAALRRQQQVVDGLTAQRAQLEATVGEQQGLLGQLEAEQAELIRQARARAAAAALARRVAEQRRIAAARAQALAAERAREQAAARAAAAEQARQQAAANAAAAEQARQQAAANAAAAEQARQQAAADVAAAALARTQAESAQAAAAAQAFQQQSQAPPPAAAAPAPAPVSTAPAAPPGNAAQIALSVALAQQGKPYVWGGAGPDVFDCSGLTMYAYAAAGISLVHYTVDQWNAGVQVSRADLQPGDLVFFGANLHHEGMYVGNGMMVDAPHTGAVVHVEPVWWDQYAGAVRIAG